MPDNYISQIDFGDGVIRKLKAEGGGGGGLSSVSFNGVEQTITSDSVDIDGANNLITESQWDELRDLFEIVVEKPIISSDVVPYNGQPQGPNMTGFNSELCTITNGEHVERGTYSFTISLKGAYYWDDGTVADITGEYTIGQGLPTATLSEDSISEWPSNTKTITIISSTGTVNGVSSNDTSIATASLNGNEITVSIVALGNTTISINMAASQDGNYAAGSYQIPVEPKAVPSWSSASDLEIVDILNAHYNNELDLTKCWNVGDERTVSLSAMGNSPESHPAQDITLVLMNIGGKTLAEPINGHNECAFIVGQKHCIPNTGIMKSTASNSGGWGSSPRKTWCNGEYRNAFPSTLLPIFKQFSNSYLTGNGTSVSDGTDYFALPARVEIDGTTANGYKDEGQQFEYYEKTNNRKKYASNTTASYIDWWTRSAHTGTSSTYRKCFVPCTASGATNDYQNANVALGIAPFGVI